MLFEKKSNTKNGKYKFTKKMAISANIAESVKIFMLTILNLFEKMNY